MAEEYYEEEDEEEIEPEQKTRTFQQYKGKKNKVQQAIETSRVEQRGIPEVAYSETYLDPREVHRRATGTIKGAIKGAVRKGFESRVERVKSATRKMITPPERKPTFAKFRSGMLGAVQLMSDQRVGGAYNPYATKTKSTKKSKGRPRGPSGKYRIEGRPVSVQEYRKWKSRMRAVERISPQQPEYYPDDAQSYESRTPPQMAEPRPPIGNILHAPNVFKGELKNVGGLGSSNADLFNIGRVNKPVDNPRGDYYTNVDPMSGKSILMRRPRERWLSGRRR